MEKPLLDRVEMKMDQLIKAASKVGKIPHALFFVNPSEIDFVVRCFELLLWYEILERRSKRVTAITKGSQFFIRLWLLSHGSWLQQNYFWIPSGMKGIEALFIPYCNCIFSKIFKQNELEVTVESLSALVARPYLRSSRSRIIHTTYLVRQKRHSFTLCISRGLMPPETPPGLRKLRKRHLPAILGIDMEEVSFCLLTQF